jgi:hypothetical protein
LKIQKGCARPILLVQMVACGDGSSFGWGLPSSPLANCPLPPPPLGVPSSCSRPHALPSSPKQTAGLYCPAGTSATIPRCEPGRYSEEGSSTCTQCPAGRFSTSIDRGATTAACDGPCRAGFFCPTGSSVDNPFVCPAGRYSLQNAGSCTDCPAGRWVMTVT